MTREHSGIRCGVDHAALGLCLATISAVSLRALFLGFDNEHQSADFDNVFLADLEIWIPVSYICINIISLYNYSILGFGVYLVHVVRALHTSQTSPFPQALV